MATRLFRHRNEILEALERSMPQTSLKLIALYNSEYDSIIEDPIFISIPITDQLIEGWGVFDTVNTYNSQPYQLQEHVNRLFFSAQKARISLSFTKEIVCEKLLEIIARYANARIRLFISGSNIFYILAYSDASQNKPTEVQEVTVSVPPKPSFLASIKSNNYLTNALCVMEARSKGGYMGICLDDNGNLAESAIANVAVVFQNKFLTPKPDYVLEGTTVKRVLQFCEKLVETGELQYCGREDINIQKAYESQEMMLIGGDAIISITKLDNFTISNGPGPISIKISEFLQQDKMTRNQE